MVSHSQDRSPLPSMWDAPRHLDHPLPLSITPSPSPTHKLTDWNMRDILIANISNILQSWYFLETVTANYAEEKLQHQHSQAEKIRMIGVSFELVTILPSHFRNMTTKIVFTTTISFNFQAMLSGFRSEYFPIQWLTWTSSCRRPAISLTILTRGARGVEERGGGLSCWVEDGGGGGDDNSCLRDISPPTADHLSFPLSAETW